MTWTMLNSIAWFFILESQWVFSVAYLRTAFWLPKIYSASDTIPNIDRNLKILSLVASLIYLTMAILLATYPHKGYVRYTFILVASCPIFNIVVGVFMVHRTVSQQPDREKLNLINKRIVLHIGFVALILALLVTVAAEDRFTNTWMLS